MRTEVGPDREHAELSEQETAAFKKVVEGHTKTVERQQLSLALRSIRWSQSITVQDGFQRCARRIWQPNIPAGSPNEVPQDPLG